MVQRRELFNFTSGIPAHIFIRFGSDNKWHFHPHLEIGYCISGTGELSMKGKEYKIVRGKFFLINSYVVHTIQNQSADFAILLMSFDLAKFEDMYENISRMEFDNLIDSQISERRQVVLYRMIAAMIYDVVTKYDGYLLRVDGMLRVISQYLADGFRQDIRQIKGPKNAESNRIKQLIAYIDEHYAQEWTLNEFAEMTQLNPQYLSRLFKQSVGLPLTKYVNSVRVQKSIPDLLESRMTIAQLSAKHGFQTVKSYYTIFTEVHDLPPGQYKRWYEMTMRSHRRGRVFEENMKLTELLSELFEYINGSEFAYCSSYGVIGEDGIADAAL